MKKSRRSDGALTHRLWKRPGALSIRNTASRVPHADARPALESEVSRRPQNRDSDRKGGRPGRGAGSGRQDGRRGGDAGRDPDRLQLWGYHPVREALRSKHRQVLRLYATAPAAERLAAEITAKGLRPEIVEPEDLSRRLPPDSVHQGLLAEVRPLEPLDISELPEKGVVLVLDQVTDPHNVGAILRTAAAHNVDAIVTTERHSPAMTGILAKSASGGLEHVPVCTVINLARALDELGRMGYLRIGLDSEGAAPLEDTVLSRPLALVLGAEGKGLRRLSRENCDFLARLDMPGPIKSLNVSNACAVALTILRLRLA
jgi:23S rRNA (guanosine2251-2'-O)-methyltransferase